VQLLEKLKQLVLFIERKLDKKVFHLLLFFSSDTVVLTCIHHSQLFLCTSHACLCTYHAFSLLMSMMGLLF
jgi:hypothetical protein